MMMFLGFTVSEPDGSTTVTEAGGTDTLLLFLTLNQIAMSFFQSSSDTGEATLNSSLTICELGHSAGRDRHGVDDDLVDGTVTSTITIKSLMQLQMMILMCC